jgi:predicted Zn-ribbon and HTH transcriptional regulator
MSTHKVIKLSDYFDSNIITRTAISKVFDEVVSKDTNSIYLDFKSINFISRSAAHELLTRIRRENKRGYFFQNINVNANISYMFSTVLKSMKNKDINNNIVTVYNLTNEDELLDVFNQIDKKYSINEPTQY